MIFAAFFKMLLKIHWNRRFFGEIFTDFCRNFGKLQTIAGSHYVLHQFLEIREKMVQKLVTSGNCLQFPEIPQEIRENFIEKSAISVKCQQHFEKNLQKSPTCAKIWKFWNVSGAKVCLSCRAWKMLWNVTWLAIVAVHTAANEPPKVRQVMNRWWTKFIAT